MRPRTTPAVQPAAEAPHEQQGGASRRRELGKPVALADGLTFAMREGGRTVGAGTVTALLD